MSESCCVMGQEEREVGGGGELGLGGEYWRYGDSNGGRGLPTQGQVIP